MLKRILVAMILVTSIICGTISFAEESTVVGLTEALSKLYAENNFTQEEQERMLEQWQNNFSINIINGTTPWSAYQKIYSGLVQYKTQDEGIEFLLEYAKPDFDSAFKVTCLNNIKYLKQYAQAGKFDYALSNVYYWMAMRHDFPLSAVFYDDSGCLISEYDNSGNRTDSGKICTELTNKIGLSEQARKFLKESDELRSLLLAAKETSVEDIQLFNINSLSLLYVKCPQNRYVISLSDVLKSKVDKFKLYTVDEMMRIIDGDYAVGNMKPTYDDEAQFLRQEDLLQGNENGLDLLKPLTRAEAVTLLVRAMGLEEQTSEYTQSRFSDISSDNWASPYAALAKEYGITTGVTETEFAPDRPVTADQFATFTLRAAGERDIDYTQGTQILIDRGIITTEQAQTMDLFTRGDMAKIIYEAREKGLL